MRLTWLRLCNFQSFGPKAVTITLDPMSFVLGPNGAGKTAVLQALVRMFGVDAASRRLRRSDFHVPFDEKTAPPRRSLWVEAQFEFPELLAPGGVKHPTIPAHFAHMQLDSADKLPRVRFRLTGELDADGEISESLVHVTEIDANGEPVKTVPALKPARSSIHVHYLPARRDPADHISYAASSLLGRALRATDFADQKEGITALAKGMTEHLAENAAVKGIAAGIASHWGTLHKGQYFKDPTLSFAAGDVESLLRHLSVGFTPGHGDQLVDFSRLSDGQQSLLYVSLVLAMQVVGRDAMAGKLKGFDLDRLRPPVFTLLAMEEPENSLSPHYLGRVIAAVTAFAQHSDAQAIVATHAPSLLKRVAPEHVRYLRLNEKRQTVVAQIIMPAAADVAHKYVREAVQAFPELYFSRLVVLGEGASEEIVLPRVLKARGLVVDDSSVSIAPLGGRHVNHFWRLLDGLGIPYVTLLDLDRGRYAAGWGRVRYAAKQILDLGVPIPNLTQAAIDALPKWDGSDDVMASPDGKSWRGWLAKRNVFFANPLDLDFAMLLAYPAAFGIDAVKLPPADADDIKAVLGKKGVQPQHYGADTKFFGPYHDLFKLGSKPVAHISALANLDDTQLLAGLPAELGQMVDAIQARLKELPE